jgi:hypothetical protein
MESKRLKRQSRTEQQLDVEGEKVRVTFLVPKPLVERLKNAVFWTPSNITMSDVATTALARAARYLEHAHNNSEPFKQRTAELKGGRPVK